MGVAGRATKTKGKTMTNEEKNLKHALEIRAGDCTVGMSYRYDGHEMVRTEDGIKFIPCEKVATVTRIKVTKTGRVRVWVVQGLDDLSLGVDRGRPCTNGPISPERFVQVQK